ncbi:molybdopterin binding domain-containing protein [Moniliophthora roreri MCA 2997]|uniref:Molybdopterin binding domain-containing protein n=1 Tax=Moniliophthora roreri (strain MCA 2997) TaxID=1381753 RepID=V2X6N2_MONRO|nr:molybdopterin binding domain-containing protein [Moniliophthora roreri MCA 2997]
MPVKPPTSSTRFLQRQQRVTSAVPRSRVEGLSSSLNPSSTGSNHIQNPLRNSSHSNTQPPHNYRQQQQIRNHFVAVMALSSTKTTTRGYTGPPPTIEHHDSNGLAAVWSSTGAQRTASGSRYHSPSLSGLSGGVRERMTGTGAGSSGSIGEPKMTTETTVIPKEFPGFEATPIPKELSKAKPIRTAAALVIGDEILNGKTMEKNSHYFAKYCFDLGIDLKRIEVIPDEEEEIIAASRRMVEKYDLVITTGGIGPTHDDITYASLAKAFNQKLEHHAETLRRMNEMNKHRSWMATMDSQQREATKRMALFPNKAEVIFIGKDIWVPVVRLEGKLCVFPGIPALFQKMLNGLTDYLPLPSPSERPLRIQIFTERPESMIAPYLTSLQARLKADGIQVGSYPVLNQGVFVSLIGRDIPSYSNNNGKLKKGPPRIWLAEVAKEVEREVGGRILCDEEVAEKKEAAKRFDPAGRPIVPLSGSASPSPPKAKI